MTALALNQQIDNNHGRSEGVHSFAAGCRGYRPAGLHERQDTRRKPGGFLLAIGLTPGRIVSSQVNSGPGLHRLGHFPRVGWCFNTARDFLEFNALTRAGIRPDHAVALLSFKSLPNQSACEAAIGPEVHSSAPSKVIGLNEKDHDTQEGRIIGKVFQYGA